MGSVRMTDSGNVHRNDFPVYCVYVFRSHNINLDLVFFLPIFLWLFTMSDFSPHPKGVFELWHLDVGAALDFRDDFLVSSVC